jgi:hypothetical protein
VLTEVYFLERALSQGGSQVIVGRSHYSGDGI